LTEVPTKFQRGNTQCAVGYTGLELRREVWSRSLALWSTTLGVVIETLGMTEIIQKGQRREST
jgi:hypothetical protein